MFICDLCVHNSEVNVVSETSTTAGVRGSPSGSSIPAEGYITTKKQLRDILQQLHVGEEASFHKATYWCKDAGYHYDLIIRREDDTYLMTFTDYHAVYSNQPLEDLRGAVETAWRWIREHNTRKYRIW